MDTKTERAVPRDLTVSMDFIWRRGEYLSLKEHESSDYLVEDHIGNGQGAGFAVTTTYNLVGVSAEVQGRVLGVTAGPVLGIGHMRIETEVPTKVQKWWSGDNKSKYFDIVRDGSSHESEAFLLRPGVQAALVGGVFELALTAGASIAMDGERIYPGYFGGASLRTGGLWRNEFWTGLGFEIGIKMVRDLPLGDVIEKTATELTDQEINLSAIMAF